MIQKTKVLTFILFGFIFLNLSAQDNFDNDPVAKLPDDDRSFRFGLHFSPNLSWFKTNTSGYSSDGSTMGFSFGLSFEYFLSKNYLVSTGFNLLNAKGALKYKDVYKKGAISYSADVVSDYKPQYLQIPLQLKLRTNEIGYFTYYGTFGFNMDFSFKSKAEYAYTFQDIALPYTSQETISSNDASADLNWINLALVIGAGVEYNISGNTSAFFGVTFNNGFINQMDTKVVELDASGDPLIDSSGDPVFSEKDVNANLNYLALNIGIYF
ncbi:MAG: PorT family protein [Flavobacteriales bacterium]|nr:PorT family protein [Flavobacteriales bacterium]